jgi:hypothetical protein
LVANILGLFFAMYLDDANHKKVDTCLQNYFTKHSAATRGKSPSYVDGCCQTLKLAVFNGVDPHQRSRGGSEAVSLVTSHRVKEKPGRPNQA